MTTVPEMPTFSVLMPVYKTGDFVERAVSSVFEQTLSDWELILTDNADPGDSMSRVADYLGDERVSVIRRTDNQGVAVARNEALEQSRGTYVVQLDSDDWLFPDYMQVVARVMDQRPYSALAAPNHLYWLDDEQRWRPEDHYTYLGLDLDDQRSDLERLLEYCFPPVPSAIRRGPLVELGGWNVEHEGIEDHELYLRLAGAGWGLETTRDALAAYRVRVSSTAHDDDGKVRDSHRLRHERLYEHVLQTYPLSRSERAMATWVLRDARRATEVDRARAALRRGDVSRARGHAFASVRSRPTARGLAIAGGITLVPNTLRRLQARRSAPRE